MKVLVMTSDKYLQRRFALELASHEVFFEKERIDEADILILDKDCFKTPIKESVNIGRVITISRTSDADLLLPLAYGTIEKTLSENENVRLRLLEKSKSVSLDNETIKLTSLEFALLNLLCEGKGDFISRKTISEKIWNGASDGLINIYIHYLREKLEKRGEKIILSSRKFGYKIDKKYLKGGSEC